MSDFKDQKYALLYLIQQKKFDIVEIGQLTDWDHETFELFRDGDRTELCNKSGECIVLLQIATDAALLSETKTFCKQVKGKHQPLSDAQKYFRPVRGHRRQSLPSMEVGA